MERMTRREKAMTYFKQGYNCSQSVTLAFADILDVEETVLSKISAPLGGGMGRLREVCGACSGMFMVLGMVCGYEGAGTKDLKAELYAKVQKLAEEFRKKNNTIICRELLGLTVQQESPVPQERNAAYYASRPCEELVGDAAEILEAYLREIGKIAD